MVESGAGIVFGCSGLLEVDPDGAVGESFAEDVFTLNEDGLAASVDDFEVGLAVFFDGVAFVNAGCLRQELAEVDFGNPASHRDVEAGCASDELVEFFYGEAVVVSDFVGRGVSADVDWLS